MIGARGGYPATPWGDAAFHLTNACRSLQVARDRARTRGEYTAAAERLHVVHGSAAGVLKDARELMENDPLGTAGRRSSHVAAVSRPRAEVVQGFRKGKT